MKKFGPVLTRWVNTPVVLEQNPITGKKDGDDDGYRDVTTLAENESAHRQLTITTRQAYKGESVYDGSQDPSLAIPGGLPNEELILRGNFALALECADAFLREQSEGVYSLCAVDGFRTQARQSGGFTKLLRAELDKLGINDANIDAEVPKVITAGLAADEIFSWVNADKTAPRYESLVTEMQQDAAFWRQIEATATANDKTIAEMAHIYVSISANSGLGRFADRHVRLDIEKNTHLGGGACDLLVLREGVPMAPTPFDWLGCEAKQDFMEKESNWQLYVTNVRRCRELQIHLERCCFKPLSLCWDDWVQIREGIRIFFHLMKAIGCTIYCNEFWHADGSNAMRHPGTGEILFREFLTADKFPNSGNPSHTVQTLGRNGISVWGGHAGHLAARGFGLDYQP